MVQPKLKFSLGRFLQREWPLFLWALLLVVLFQAVPRVRGDEALDIRPSHTIFTPDTVTPQSVTYVVDTLADSTPIATPAKKREPAEVAPKFVKVNTAGVHELDFLPGIGPALAQRIIDDRTANGLYRSLSDLQRVKGIGPKTAEKFATMVLFE